MLRGLDGWYTSRWYSVFPASFIPFFSGRKQLLVFASSSEKITFVVGGTDKKLLRDFALKVEEQ